MSVGCATASKNCGILRFHTEGMVQASQCAPEMGRRAVGFAQTVKGRGELVVGLGSILPVIYGPIRLA